MSLIDKLEEVFLEEFNKLDMSNLDSYVRENRELIVFLCNSKEGINEKIEEGLGGFIIKKVRENYYSKLYRGITPEYLPNPEYLAYAFQENVFSADELRKINFQKDSWVYDFIKKHSKKDLLKNLREKLLFSE